MKPDIDVKVTCFDGPDQIRIEKIRTQVFSHEQGVDPDIDFDGQDMAAVHVLAICKGQVAGTGRLLADGHIGRLAVLKSARRCGAGQALVRQLVAQARSQGLTRVFLGAQEHAVGFYEKLGFSCYGVPYEEAGIRHIHKEKQILLADG
jgi:predicted GNAT family N-acyltransferase